MSSPQSFGGDPKSLDSRLKTCGNDTGEKPHGDDRRRNGFLLIEALIAFTLFSIASAGVGTSFYQTMKAEKRMRESFESYDPIRLSFLQMDKDLRNTVRLKDYPFQGNASRIQFPIRRQNELSVVEYKVENKKLYRTEKKIVEGLRQKEEKGKEKRLAEATAVEFSFPYEDGNGMRQFQNHWFDDPYQGLPRAVSIKMGGLEKVVSIPQGRVGVLDERN